MLYPNRKVRYDDSSVSDADDVFYMLLWNVSTQVGAIFVVLDRDLDRQVIRISDSGSQRSRSRCPGVDCELHRMVDVESMFLDTRTMGCHLQ